jgi:hypothetical protein
MAFPKTFDEMKSAGYKFSNDANCRGCGDEIEWWETPAGKKLPMNPMTAGISPAISHWSTCSDAPSFRRKS